MVNAHRVKSASVSRFLRGVPRNLRQDRCFLLDFSGGNCLCRCFMLLSDEDEVDSIMEKGTSNKIVSLVIVPDEAPNGSYCYKMLIHPESHKLYYFRKHKISKKYGPGFLQEDIIRINNQRGR